MLYLTAETVTQTYLTVFCIFCRLILSIILVYGIKIYTFWHMPYFGVRGQEYALASFFKIGSQITDSKVVTARRL